MALEQRRVFAVLGRLLPSMTRPKQYVGYELLADPDAKADHVIPGGSRYRIKPEGEMVTWDAYHRQACGDNGGRGQDITETPPLTVKAAKKAEV